MTAVASKSIVWLSPSAIGNMLQCLKMHAEKAFDLGNVGDMGGLRHLALEVHLQSRMDPGSEPISLHDAAEMARDDYKGKLSEADLQKAVDQVSATPEHGLPDPDTILSLEGSNLPEQLMLLASTHPEAKPMLHVVVRDKPGKWGPAYGIRMKIDVLHMLDETDDLGVTDFKGRDPCYEPGSNDIQALVNFVGVCAIAKAMGLSPQKFKWTGLGIPSLKTDVHEFWVENVGSAIETLDKINATWAELRDKPTETPGRHCGKCKLNGTARCSAWKGASGPVVVQGQWEKTPTEVTPQLGESVATWGDNFIVEVYQALKAREGQIEALLDLVKPEISRRAKIRQIGPDGFKFVTRSQGNASIDWQVNKLLDLFEEWKIDPRHILGITAGKKSVETFVVASTNDRLERKTRLERLKGVYKQGSSNILKLAPLASTDVAGVPPKDTVEPPAVDIEEQRRALGMDLQHEGEDT